MTEIRKPLVSVILPFFNAEKTLLRAIDSIALQTLSNFECVLVDNNSSDRSIEIAEARVLNDSRFKLISEQRQGVVYASNTGAEHACADFISRMDADDYSYAKRLELQCNFLNENKDFGAVCCRVEYKTLLANTKGFSRYVNWVNSVESYSDILLKRFVESPIVNPSAMWRKSVALKNGMYRNGDFPEDYEMWLRWLDSGVKIGKLEDCLLQWHDSETRLTRTNSIYSDQAFFRIKTKYLVNELKKCNRFFPKVAVWGASKTSRKRAEFLTKNGIEIAFYIDVKRTRQLSTEVIYYKDIPEQGSCFILVYIKPRDLRIRIQNYLEDKNYIEGRDYLLLS